MPPLCSLFPPILVFRALPPAVQLALLIWCVGVRASPCPLSSLHTDRLLVATALMRWQPRSNPPACYLFRSAVLLMLIGRTSSPAAAVTMLTLAMVTTPLVTPRTPRHKTMAPFTSDGEFCGSLLIKWLESPRIVVARDAWGPRRLSLACPRGPEQLRPSNSSAPFDVLQLHSPPPRAKHGAHCIVLTILSCCAGLIRRAVQPPRHLVRPRRGAVR